MPLILPQQAIVLRVVPIQNHEYPSASSVAKAR